VGLVDDGDGLAPRMLTVGWMRELWTSTIPSALR
jgi:hypothetical protein